MNEKLRDIVLTKGSDPYRWTGDQRREATTEFYEQDEKPADIYGPSYMNDALMDFLDAEENRREIIRALQGTVQADVETQIGRAISRALVMYALNTLEATAIENEAAWRREEREAAEHQEAYSQRKAREAV